MRCGDQPGRYDITYRMLEHNHLEILVELLPLVAADLANDDGSARLPGGLVGEVRLDIEA